MATVNELYSKDDRQTFGFTRVAISISKLTSLLGMKVTLVDVFLEVVRIICNGLMPVFVTRDESNDVLELLKLMGAPCNVIDGDEHLFCAAMVQNKFVVAVLGDKIDKYEVQMEKVFT